MTKWRGPSVEGEVPTLGWQVVDFIQTYVIVPDGEFEGEPFKLAPWQLDFVLGFYQLHPDAEVDLTKPSRAFEYTRGGQLVAPQKIGKGPLFAALALAEAYGPVLFDGWNANGEPVGRPWATPLIQVTAVSLDQTDNVWRALVPMIERGELAHDIPDTGTTRINLPGGGRLEPVTASGRSRLGQRLTCAIQDEAHDWLKNNGGRRLADTQRRNLAGMGGRFLESGNAWDPSEDSVAQETFEHETGVYKMMLHGGDGSVRNKRERMRVLHNLYGDSWWVDPERISEEIDTLLKRGDLAQAERFFMNRIVPGEDRAMDRRRWNELADKEYVVPPKSRIVIGVDGARYRDALGVVACEVSTGYVWPLGIWERPPDAGEDYEHPLHEVDAALADAMEYYDVWRVYIDPGSQAANITYLAEQWQGKYGAKRVVEWLMSRPRQTAFAVRHLIAAIHAGDLKHNGDETLSRHVANARRRDARVRDEDGREMYVLSKEHPNSPNKIDGAAALVLAWEARGDAVAKGKGQRSRYADDANKCGSCGHLRRQHSPKCRVCEGLRGDEKCRSFQEPSGVGAAD